VLAGLGLLTVWFPDDGSLLGTGGLALVAAVQDRVKRRSHCGKGFRQPGHRHGLHNVKISRPKVILSVKQVEVSLSLLSFFKLAAGHPHSGLRQPEVFLHRMPTGVWNVADLRKKRPPPPFSHIHLRGIQIKDGPRARGPPPAASDLPRSECAAQSDHSVAGRPQVTVVVHQGSLGVTSASRPTLASRRTWP